MAESVGFEPTVSLPHFGFQNRCLNPLGQLSEDKLVKYRVRQCHPALRIDEFTTTVTFLHPILLVLIRMKSLSDVPFAAVPYQEPNLGGLRREAHRLH